MTLWQSLPYNPEETLLSYADRLSMIHTGRGMERLVWDADITLEHFTSDHEEAVSAFAKTAGLLSEDAEQGAIRVFQRGASFRGEHVSINFVSPRAARYCSSCLAEDGLTADRRFRLIWGFRHVVRCDHHSSWLIDAPCENETNLRLAIGTEILGETKAAATGTPDYLSWLSTRLYGQSHPSIRWIDDQTLEQVLLHLRCWAQHWNMGTVSS